MTKHLLAEGQRGEGRRPLPQNEAILMKGMHRFIFDDPWKVGRKKFIDLNFLYTRAEREKITRRKGVLRDCVLKLVGDVSAENGDEQLNIDKTTEKALWQSTFRMRRNNLDKH